MIFINTSLIFRNYVRYRVWGLFVGKIGRCIAKTGIIGMKVLAPKLIFLKNFFFYEKLLFLQRFTKNKRFSEVLK